MSFVYDPTGDQARVAAPVSAAPGDPMVPTPAGPSSNQVNSGLGGGQQPDTSKSTLWMGELEPWYDETAVRNIWQSVGENVTSVKLIRDRFSGASAGYCFVDFGNPATAANVLMTFNGKMIPNSNRVFRLNWASGGGIVDKREDRGPEFSIFVGDLSPEVTEMELLQVFQARYPSCKSVKIMTDPATTVSRGYGFVRFADEAQMQRSLTEMQGYYLGNRPIRVSTATPKTKPGAPNQAAYAAQAAAYMPAQYYGGASAPGGAPQGINQFTDPHNTTVFVGGLSAQVTEDDLRHYFGGFGDITYVRIPPGKGCGFVQFVQRASAEAAITQMQGYPIGNSRVRLSWGRSQHQGMSGPYRGASEPPVYPQIAGVGGVPGQPLDYGPFGPIAQQPPRPEAVLGVGQDPAEPVPVARLNELYLAAKDGRLDRLDADGRGYHGVYAQ